MTRIELVPVEPRRLPKPDDDARRHFTPSKPAPAEAGGTADRVAVPASVGYFQAFLDLDDQPRARIYLSAMRPGVVDFLC